MQSQYYCLSWSGGVDSTCSVIIAHEHGIHIDEIIFAETMYSHKYDISGESPWHLQFIYDSMEIFKDWGYPVKIIRDDSDYLSEFNHIITKATKYPEHNGKRYGFPLAKKGACCIKRDLKLRACNRYVRTLLKEGWDVVNIVGICANETSRLASLHTQETPCFHPVSLLETYGISHNTAKRICEDHNMLSPIYRQDNNGNSILPNRSGCWFCPYAKIGEMALVKQNNPKIWEAFVALEDNDDLAFPLWNIYGKSLHQIDQMI